MKEGWELKKLSEVCDLQNGFAFKSKWYVDKSNTLNVRMSNIRPDGTFNPEHNIKYLPDELANDYKQYLLSEGDLVIAMTDMAGDPKILGVPTLVCNLKNRNFLLNQRVGKLTDFSDNIFVPYLRYFLSSPKIKEYYKSKGAGGLQINISKQDILTAEIPIPPLTEQKAIVAILDQAFAAIDNAIANIEKNIENAKELFQSKLNEIFSQKGDGWESIKLSEIAEFKNGLNFSKSSSGESIKLVGVADFQNYFDVQTKKLNSVQIDGNISELYELKEGDLLTVRSNGNPKLIGRCIVANEVNQKTSHSGFTIRIRPDSKTVDSKYLCHLMKSSKLRNEMIDGGNGINIKSLNQTTLGNLEIVLPTEIDKQKLIAKELAFLSAKIKKLRKVYKQKIVEIDEIKKSLLQKAFEGELT